MFDCKMTKQMIVIAGVVAIMIAVIASVAVLRNRRQPVPLQEVQTMPMPSDVRVNAVEHKSVTIAGASGASASSAVSMICGESAAADRYEARNDALRSIARRRDLSEEDVAALMEYIAATDCVMRVEREAALKNDVLNLLRSQKRQPEGLADLLLEMVASKQYAPVVVDYCIQHLGAMVGSVPDDTSRNLR